MLVLTILLLIFCVSFGFIYWQVQQTAAETMPAEVQAYHAQELKYFEGVPSPTIAELTEVLRGQGFDEAASQLGAVSQPCFRLVPSAEEDASPRTRVGGTPDLPDLALWPRWEGLPLAFLAQIDLAELAELNSGSPLPSTGLLLFFYDADQRTWGFSPEDRESWRVLYIAEPFTPVAIDAWPDDLPDKGCYDNAPVFVEAGESLHDEFIDRCIEGKSPRESAMLEDIIDQYQQCYEGAAHQVLGFPSTIQGDMRLECQLASHGIDCGDETGFQDPRAKALETGAADWRLLFQLDTDERAHMMWGDLGTLYFLIREQDLAARRFDQVWMVLQCA